LTNGFCKGKVDKKQTKKEILTHQSAYSLYQEAKQNNQENKLSKYIEELPLEQKVAQLFIINLEGNKTFRSYETYQKITGKTGDTPLIAGGYLFFSYNLGDTVEQTQDYIKSIRKYSRENNSIQPFLAIDQEGGYVNRLRKLTGGLPSQEKVAQTNSVNQAYLLYGDQAKKMINIGFDMNLAPVVEICTEENKDFLEGRSFGDKKNTIDYSFAAVNGYQNNGIGTVIKHFPGNTNTDPHSGLPEILLNEEELKSSLESFKYVISVNPDGILMSHARTKAIDSEVPACLSKVWVTDILRNEYKYDGIIFSDDIFMGALASNGYPPQEAAVRAIEAGIDCIMISEKRFSKPAKVIYEKALSDKEFENKINKAVERILKYKINKGLLEL